MKVNEFAFAGTDKFNFIPALAYKENDTEHTNQRIFLLGLHKKFKDTYSSDFCEWQWWLVPQMEYSITQFSITKLLE